MGTQSAWHQRWGRPRAQCAETCSMTSPREGSAPIWVWPQELPVVLGRWGGRAGGRCLEAYWIWSMAECALEENWQGPDAKKKILTKSQNGQGLWLNMGFRPCNLKGVRLPMQDWGSSRLLREARKAGEPHRPDLLSAKQTCRGKPATFQWQKPLPAYSESVTTQRFFLPSEVHVLPPLNSCSFTRLSLHQTLASCHHQSLLGINQGLHSKHLLWRE